jgi:hypothetical protein
MAITLYPCVCMRLAALAAHARATICTCIRGDSNACEAMRLGPARWEFGSFVPAGLVYTYRMHIYMRACMYHVAGMLASRRTDRDAANPWARIRAHAHEAT